MGVEIVEVTSNETVVVVNEEESPLVLEVLAGTAGAVGPANILTPGTVTTGAPGSSAIISITGTSPSQVINFTIPRGDVGATGPAPNFTIGTVSTVAVGGSATASVTGTNPNYVLNIGIPTGATGATGPAPNVSIGTVTTVAAGGSATASVTGTNPNYAVNLGIPTGATGAVPTINSSITVTTGAPGTSASASWSGSNPYSLSLTIPRGDPGAGNVSSSGALIVGNLAMWNSTGGLIQDAGFAASDVLRLSTNQTVSGNKTFSTSTTFDAGSDAILVKPGTSDNAHISIYARTATPTTRTGIVGYVGSASTTLLFNNEISTGAISIGTTGNGNIGVNAGTGTVTLTGTTVSVTGNLTANGNIALNGTAVDANIGMIAAQQIADPSAAKIGASFNRTISLTANNANNIIGGTFNVSTLANAFNHTGTLYGGDFSVQNQLTGIVSSANGIKALIYNVGTGTITDGAAVRADIQNLNAAGIITRAYGVRVEMPVQAGTLTNTYGVYIGDITSGTQTNQAYGVYQIDSNARNWFGGNTIFGLDLTANGNARFDTRVTIGSAVAPTTGENLMVMATFPATTVNGSNFYKGQTIHTRTVPISAGVIDSGYRVGLGVESYVDSAAFAGTLTDQRGLWARVGSNSVNPTGTITNSYGVYIENLDGGATVTNKYGLYQSNTTAKNYFGGNVNIGAENNTYKLYVSGTANVTGTLLVGGVLTATGGFSGSGASLTALSGTAITSGTVADARLSSNVVLATGAQTIAGTKTFSSGPIITSGANTFKFNDGAASTTPNIGVGTSSGKSATLLVGTSYAAFIFDQTGSFKINKDTKANIDGGASSGGTDVVTVAATGNIVTIGTMTATSFIGSGSSLTGLSGTEITTGTVADARLSVNVPLLTLANVFTDNLSVVKSVVGPTTFTLSNPSVDATGYSVQSYLKIAVGGTTIGGLKSTNGFLTGLTTKSLYMTTEGAFPIAFGTDNSSTPRMVIMPTTGRVGIANAAPSEMLDVTGNIKASGTVTGSSFIGSGAALTGLTISQISGGAPLASPTFTGTVTGITATMVGLGNVTNAAQMTKTLGGSEAVAVASGTSGTVTLDVSTANIFTVSPTAAITTLSITNVPASGTGCTITLFVTQGATPYAVATPSGGVFYGAVTPSQVANKRCAFTYITTNGGTTWHCSAAVEV